MSNTTPTSTCWIVTQTNDLLPFLNDVLTNVHDNYYADIEDVIELAVFHLNDRERPLSVDPLLGLYSDGAVACPTVLADAIEVSAMEIHRRLAMLVPDTITVVEFTYEGDDIIVGGNPID
jgi:hypothetical protein